MPPPPHPRPPLQEELHQSAPGDGVHLSAHLRQRLLRPSTDTDRCVRSARDYRHYGCHHTRYRYCYYISLTQSAVPPTPLLGSPLSPQSLWPTLSPCACEAPTRGQVF